MVSLPCFECGKAFKDLATFNLHFRIAHQNCTKFVCKIGNCSRSYSLFGSFAKHVVNFHDVPRHSNQPCQSGTEVKGVSNPGVIDYSCIQEAIPVDIYENKLEDVDVKQLLIQQQDILVAKLYANPAFPRNIVDKMIQDFSAYLTSPYFDKLREVVDKSLEPYLSVESRKEISDMFDVLMNPFSHLTTEYRRFKYFESKGDYIKPISFTIDYREERVKSKDGVGLEMKKVTGQFIPLRALLKKLFELPDALSDTLSNMESLQKESEWICNLVQCEAWKRKRSRFAEDDIVIPLNVYYDECEPNNALGPHTDPLGCTYVHIPVLPSDCVSKLENILLCLLIDSDNRTVYGNRKVFQVLVSELEYLEKNSVEVTTPELGTVQVYFVLCFVLGDNKALNGVCGYVESFTAHHYCRICLCPKNIAQTLCVENVEYMRTPENYAADVLREDPSVTGIKEQCVFNSLESFEMPTDVCLDEFHDLIEGVAHYSMLPILNHFNDLNKRFIPTLNSRLYCIDLGVDGDNRPPLINVDRLNCDKLKMTGSEMYTFVRLFGVLVCDLVPEDDDYYKLYLLLHDIMSILHAKGLPKDAHVILKAKVKDHHSLYLKLTKELLKPKHHFLLHYAGRFQYYGPFGLLSTIRFEAKHRSLTLTADSCYSRVNLSKTCAIKQQLGFCFRSVSKSSIRQRMEVGPSTRINLKDLDQWPAFSLTLPDSVFSKPEQDVSKWVNFKGTKYQVKQVLVIDADSSGLFIFAEIQMILILEGEPLFLCSPYETVGFVSNVRGYEVISGTGLHWCAIYHSSLLDPHPLWVYTLSNGDKVIVPKYFL